MRMIGSVRRILGRLIGIYRDRKISGIGRFRVQYKNFDPERYSEFAYISKLGVRVRGGIYLLDIFHTQECIGDIIDEHGYDEYGSYISIFWKDWFSIETGERVGVGMGEEVECCIKVYSERRMRACYIETVGSRTIVNFIPYEYLRFSDSDIEFSGIE